MKNGKKEAGAGGIYFDIFAANSTTYDRHDGASREIDPADFTLKRRYARCLILEEAAKLQKPTPISVYDTAGWVAVSVLSEQSILLGSSPVAMPDFTNGKWICPAV